MANERALMKSILEPLRAAARSPLPHDGEFTSWHKITEGYLGLYEWRLGDALRLIRDGAALSIASKVVAGVEGRSHHAAVLLECGQFEEAFHVIEDWIEAARLRGLDWMIGLAACSRSRALAGMGRVDEAIAHSSQFIVDPVRSNADLACYALAEALLAAGRLAEAADAARTLLAREPAPIIHLPARLVLASVRLARAELPEAKFEVEAGLALLAEGCAAPVHRVGILYAEVRLLRATGRDGDAGSKLTALRAAVDAMAVTFDDAHDRAAFLAIPVVREISDHALLR
jgi:tetratricopeptide (TPR) repeat protein